MKVILFLFMCFIPFWAKAQCPYISGLLADAEASGLPAGEGKNEFFVFNTGSSSINVNSIFLSYGTTTTSTAFSIDGAAIPNVWLSPTTSGLLSNTSGTITQVTSGSIPANRNVVVISKDNAVSYDFQTFGTDVYVLSYDQTLAGVSGFLLTGRFPNTGAADRYLRISQGATCRDTVSYIPDNLPGADGGGVKWNASGVATYANTGSSGVVLPVQLLGFEANIKDQLIELNWSTASGSSAEYFEIEKSTNGKEYTAIAKIVATKTESSNAHEYVYKDEAIAQGQYFYRLKIVDALSGIDYSPTVRINYTTKSKLSTVFPNPTNSYITILNHAGFETASFIDVTGKTIATIELSSGNNKIDLSKLSKAIYLLQLKSATTIENHKIAKE